MTTMHHDYYTREAILQCLVAALEPEVARDFHKAYREGDSDAQFTDRFIAQAIEAGLLDAEDHTDSEAWKDACDQVLGEEGFIDD